MSSHRPKERTPRTPSPKTHNLTTKRTKKQKKQKQKKQQKQKKRKQKARLQTKLWTRMIFCRRGRFPHRGAGRSRHPMSGGFARYQPSRWPCRCATLGKVSMRQNACGSDAILLSLNTKRPTIEGFLYTVTTSRTSHIGSGSQRARINAKWTRFRRCNLSMRNLGQSAHAH